MTDPSAMGATITPAGTGFRLWAPHADSVHVIGDWNGWDRAAHPLSQDGEVWTGFVPGVGAGAQYRFVLTHGDTALERVDPYASQVTNSVGNGVLYDHATFDWQGDAFVPPLMNEAIIYELHIGSFAASGGTVGNLWEARGKFDHLAALAVNMIQIMPVAEFAGDYSWGYNPAHIFAVESAYGGPDALKSFVREAHQRGIGVILDVVYNHFGPSDLNLWQFDGWSQDGKGGIYFYNDWRSTTPWGDTRPDYGREQVRTFIHDNALAWMRHYHLDGLRLDMTPYIRTVTGFSDDLPDGWSLMKELNSLVKGEFPRAITIAEDLHSFAAITRPDGAGFSAQWDAQFVHPIRAAVIDANDADRSMGAVAAAITYSYGDPFARVIYTESHDEVANGKARVPQEVDPGDPEGYFAQKRSTLGAGFVFTTPGIPMLFQGQEFLEGGWFRDNVPLDWAQDSEFKGIVRLYRDLIGLRRNLGGVTAGLTGGNVQIITADDTAKVIAYHRWMNGGAGDDVVVVANLSDKHLFDYWIGLPNAGEWVLRFNSDANDYSPAFTDVWTTNIHAITPGRDGMPASGGMALGPYTMLVFSQEP